MSRKSPIFAIFCSSLLFGVAQAKDPSSPVGIYSNMHFATEDVIGVEVFIVYTNSGFYASVQCAEGVPGIPEVVPVKYTSGAVVTFTIPENTKSGCPTTEFEGTLSNSGLTGIFKGVTDWPGLMPRGKSYWQQ